MANPTLLDMPIARDGNKNTIPTTDNGTTGRLSQQYGWQLINAIPPQQGGKAVKREDFNGALYLLSNLLFHIQKGYTFEFDSKQSYWKGCKVRDPATGLTYQALNDIPANSTNSPHEDATNWVICPAEQGYIIPSTAYAVGATANHYALPPSYYLECTTPGTTGATTPVITSVTAGDTITDGTVVWTIRKCFPTSGGAFIGASIARNVNNASLLLIGGTDTTHGASLQLNGKDRTNSGLFYLMAHNDADSMILEGNANGTLRWGSNYLSEVAIVAESFGEDRCYVKYGSGLILQCGRATAGTAIQTVTLPISYQSHYFPFVMVATGAPSNVAKYSVSALHLSDFRINNDDVGSPNFFWFTIGY